MLITSFMKLSQNEFKKRRKQNKLVLSLIGMSNTGKTFWSHKMMDVGFYHVNCDDLIESKLGDELKLLGYSGIEDVSRWMGQPHEEHFAVNQQKYLLLEKEVMEEMFAQVANETNQNVVIDTTGSVVHLDKQICFGLKEKTFILCLDTTDDMQEKMFQQYLEQPKPVVFGELYDKHSDETNQQALARSYQKLLEYRRTLYLQYADVVLPREKISPELNANQFLSLIEQSL